MTETWLTGNRRALGLALVPLVAIAALAIWLIGAFPSPVGRLLGWVLLACAAANVGVVFHQLRQPRIAYRDGKVLFYLRARRPVAAPVEAVEAFFLGQGLAGLPAVDGKPPETVNLVARISQRYPEFEHADVKRALGRWCGHYATISGTWCEPLTNEVIRRLNRRLREVQESAKGVEREAPS